MRLFGSIVQVYALHCESFGRELVLRSKGSLVIGMKGRTVNWDQMEGRWKQERGKAVYRWGKTMNDELSAILGRYEELVGKLQEKYGIAKDEARHRVEEYRIIVKQLKEANSKLVNLHKELGRMKKTGKRNVKRKSLPGKSG